MDDKSGPSSWRRTASRLIMASMHQQRCLESSETGHTVLCLGDSLRLVFDSLLKHAVDWIILYRFAVVACITCGTEFCTLMWCFTEGYTNFAKMEAF